MIFRDMTGPLPPAPPAPPAMPYRVEDRPFGTTGRTQPTKIYASGLTDFMTEDEAGVWARISHLERMKAGEAVGSLPPSPYEAEAHIFGHGEFAKPWPVKKYPPSANRIGGEGLSDEEQIALRYLRALEAEVAAKRDAELDNVSAVGLPDLLAPTVEPVAPPVVTAVPETVPVVVEATEESGNVGVLEAAKSFLLDALKGGYVLVGDLEPMATAAGVGMASLKRAKSSLGILSRKIGVTGWAWELPAAEDGEQAEEVAKPAEAGQLVIEAAQPQPVG